MYGTNCRGALLYYMHNKCAFDCGSFFDHFMPVYLPVKLGQTSNVWLLLGVILGRNSGCTAASILPCSLILLSNNSSTSFFWNWRTGSAFSSLAHPLELAAFTSAIPRTKVNCLCGHHWVFQISAKSIRECLHWLWSLTQCLALLCHENGSG